MRVMVLVLLAGACADRPRSEDATLPVRTEDGASLMDPQVAFWNNLLTLCDAAYGGRLIEAPPGDTLFADRPLVMHVAVCGDEEIQIPLHVGSDRSRIWILTRDEMGLRLKHDHRDETGSEVEPTWYGGQTRDVGTDTEQEFFADGETAAMMPEAATGVWTIEVIPDDVFVYTVRREAATYRYRIEFDLTRTMSTPPPSWRDARR